MPTHPRRLLRPWQRAALDSILRDALAQANYTAQAQHAWAHGIAVHAALEAVGCVELYPGCGEYVLEVNTTLTTGVHTMKIKETVEAEYTCQFCSATPRTNERVTVRRDGYAVAAFFGSAMPEIVPEAFRAEVLACWHKNKTLAENEYREGSQLWAFETRGRDVVARCLTGCDPSYAYVLNLALNASVERAGKAWFDRQQKPCPGTWEVRLGRLQVMPPMLPETEYQELKRKADAYDTLKPLMARLREWYTDGYARTPSLNATGWPRLALIVEALVKAPE